MSHTNDFLLALGEFAQHKQKMVEATKKAMAEEAEELGAASMWVDRSSVMFFVDEESTMKNHDGSGKRSTVYDRFLSSVDRKGFIADWYKERGWC